MALASSSCYIETLWSSILPKSAVSECQNDDEEIVKLNLLLKATQLFVIEIRKSQVSASLKLNSVTEQLRRTSERIEHREAELLALQVNIASLKNEVEVAVARAKIFQREAQTATAKYERIQSNVSAEVNNKVRAMFDNFLQQNKNGTALAMMTQVYSETQQQESEAVHFERPVPSSTRIAKPKQHLNYSDVSSPEIIPLTPEVRKFGFNASKSKDIKIKSSQQSMCKAEPPLPPSIPSSPDLINGTPSPVNCLTKKDNKKRRDTFINLCNKDSNNINFDEKIHDKDTQDPVTIRSVLADNFVVPGTFDNVNYGMEEHNSGSIEKESENDSLRSKNEKENCKHFPPVTINNIKEMEVEMPSTPKKGSKAREKSPILGNSGSKKTSNLFKISGAGHTMSDLDVSKATPSKSEKKNKKQIQQSIKASFNRANISKSSKLSLSGKKRTDISKKPEFNGGQRSLKDLSIDGSHLDESEGEQRTILNSLEENSHESLLEDSDATMFELECSVSNKMQEVIKKDASFVPYRGSSKTPQTTNIGEVDEKSQALFEPMFASTMTDQAKSSKRRSPSHSQIDSSIGKPLMSSTEYNVTEGSRLLDKLAALMDENPIQDTMPYPLETSYDRLPKVSNSPKYAYAGPAVRKKAQRQKLAPAMCKTCGEFFDLVFGDDQAAKKAALDECTRCRSRYPQPKTPPGYWDPVVPSPTQDILPQQQLSP